MSAGRLIVFEGPEGVGKTTQLRRLAAWLDGRGVAHLVVREPGGTPIGDDIRRLLLDSSSEIDAHTEALLFMASRAALVSQVIEPSLARGLVVVADRFFLSTYAYQVAGRGLDEAQVRAANALATHGLVPDLTVLLTVPAHQRRSRAARRGSPDRMERAGDPFHARVEQAFALSLAPDWQIDHPECGPIVAVDGEGSEDAVFDRILATLAERWPGTFQALGASHR